MYPDYIISFRVTVDTVSKYQLGSRLMSENELSIYSLTLIVPSAPSDKKIFRLIFANTDYSIDFLEKLTYENFSRSSYTTGGVL